MCFYPQYPEVRFSGFLKGCKEGPSELLSETKRGHEEGRCLFFGTVKDTGEGMGHVVALVVGAPSPAAQYVLNMDTFEKGHVCPVVFQGQRKPGEFSILEEALLGIMGKKIIPWRLRNDGTIDKPYIAPNAPGLTLEAELGVGENAIPGPDFDIWELKAIKQPSLERRSNHPGHLVHAAARHGMDNGTIPSRFRPALRTCQRHRRKRQSRRVLLHFGRH